MTAQRARAPQQRKNLNAETLHAEITSFRLRLAAGCKAAKTIHTYAEVVQWMAWLLATYSSAYASNQYRALQQFFKWLAAEEDLPGPMAGRPPPVPKLVPVFTDAEFTRLEKACAGRAFA